jgi:streptogramin lyase
MKRLYALAGLRILLAGCSASHTANPTSVLLDAPSLMPQDGARAFDLSTNNILHRYHLPQTNSHPFFMATGSDKNVWFTESSSPSRIGKITRTGSITEYAVPTRNTLFEIAVGATGTLWFSEGRGVGPIMKPVILVGER